MGSYGCLSVLSGGHTEMACQLVEGGSKVDNSTQIRKMGLTGSAVSQVSVPEPQPEEDLGGPVGVTQGITMGAQYP